MLLVESKLHTANAIEISMRAVQGIRRSYAAPALLSLPLLKKTEGRGENTSST